MIGCCLATVYYIVDELERDLQLLETPFDHPHPIVKTEVCQHARSVKLSTSPYE